MTTVSLVEAQAKLAELNHLLSPTAHAAITDPANDFSVRPEPVEGWTEKPKSLTFKPFMVRQAYHERLKLMALTLQPGSVGNVFLLPTISWA